MKRTSQWPLVIALGLGFASRVLFFPDTAGNVSLGLSIFMGIGYLAAFYVPWKSPMRVKKLIRDTLIVLGFNISTSAIAGFITGGGITSKLNICIVFATILLAAILNRSRLLPEVAYICIGVWALGIINVPFMNYNWLAWMFGFFYVWYCMWLAVGIVFGIMKLKSPTTASRLSAARGPPQPEA